LLTLAQLGYLRAEGRLFSLTPRVLELATAYLSASPAATILQPCCERLAGEFNATFSVAALEGEYAVMVAYATPRRMYMEATGVGLRLPAFCSAVGRVLLAGLDPVERDRFLKQLRPKAVTVRTETNKTRLREILEGVAVDGYAFARRRKGRFRAQHRHARRPEFGGVAAGDVPSSAARGGAAAERTVDLAIERRRGDASSPVGYCIGRPQ
jgi:IclR family pca regulon transcriptional regulator